MDWNLDPFYTDTCSAATIQSTKKGFFFDYVDHVLNTVGGNWLKTKFANNQTDKQRLQSLVTDKKSSKAVLETLRRVAPLYRGKDAAVSREKRLLGDAALSAGNPRKAVALYSQAVLRAPIAGADVTIDAGLSLPLALWCRASALSALSEDMPPLCETRNRCIPGNLALADLQEAMKAGLPQTQRAELYRRMGKCYTTTGEYARAKVSFGLTKRILEESGDLEGFTRLELDLLELEMMEKEQPDKKTQIMDSKSHLPELAGGKHNSLPGACANIAVNQEQGDAGRYVVASKPLKTGDTVLFETPLGACLAHDKYGTNCYHCFERLQAPVGCTNCAAVAFCSVKCRDKSLETYHRFECHYLDLLIGSGMSILCHLALRLVCQNLNPQKAIDSLTGSTPIGKLCTHRERRTPKDYAMRALMALFLTTCLKRSGFFGIDQKIDLLAEEVKFDDEQIEIAVTLVHLLQTLQFNAHEMYETRLGPDHIFTGSKPISIGVAVYSTGSLFNHDCYPSVLRYFIGDRIVLKCSRPVAPGEAVSENYGPIFTKRTLVERQRSLGSRYWFKCSCQACQEDWPMFKNMANNSKIRCPSSRCNKMLQKPSDPQKPVRCSGCKKNVVLRDQMLELLECQQQYQDAAQLMEEENTEEAIQMFCSALDRFHLISDGPHKDTHVAQEALRSCLASTGNIFRSPKSLPQSNNIEVLEPRMASACTITEID